MEWPLRFLFRLFLPAPWLHEEKGRQLIRAGKAVDNALSYVYFTFIPASFLCFEPFITLASALCESGSDRRKTTRVGITIIKHTRLTFLPRWAGVKVFVLFGAGGSGGCLPRWLSSCCHIHWIIRIFTIMIRWSKVLAGSLTLRCSPKVVLANTLDKISVWVGAFSADGYVSSQFFSLRVRRCG